MKKRIENCDCNFTGECSKCRELPSFIGYISDIITKTIQTAQKYFYTILSFCASMIISITISIIIILVLIFFSIKAYYEIRKYF